MRGDSGAHLIGCWSGASTVWCTRQVRPDRVAARQFVNHGHVKVNGRRVNIPSSVQGRDVVEVKEASRQLALVLRLRARRELRDWDP